VITNKIEIEHGRTTTVSKRCGSHAFEIVRGKLALDGTP
jgi:hypothetical protein